MSEEKAEGCRTFTLAPSRALGSHLPDSTRVQEDGAGKAETGCAGFQPRWIQGDSKVGTESASLEKYIFNHRYREVRNG